MGTVLHCFIPSGVSKSFHFCNAGNKLPLAEPGNDNNETLKRCKIAPADLCNGSTSFYDVLDLQMFQFLKPRKKIRLGGTENEDRETINDCKMLSAGCCNGFTSFYIVPDLKMFPFLEPGERILAQGSRKRHQRDDKTL